MSRDAAPRGAAICLVALAVVAHAGPGPDAGATAPAAVLLPTGCASVQSASAQSASEQSASEQSASAQSDSARSASELKGRKRPTDCSGAFFFDVSEVTREQYRRCVDAGPCPKPDIARCFGGTEPDFWSLASLPMTCVTYSDAVTYCAFVGKRLPTERQWIRAGRGAGKRRYPWGDAAPSCERVAGLVRWRKGAMATDPCPGEVADPPSEPGAPVVPPVRLAPVCTHPAGNTPEGVCDLAGNAGEWVDASPVGRHPLERLIKGASPLGPEPDFIELDAQVWILSPSNPLVGFRCVSQASPLP